MNQSQKHFIVVGGGIGGLTAAIALTQRGHRVEVLERAPELRAVGAGITVQINAMRALGKLGLGQAVAAAGAVIRQAQVLNWNGDEVSGTDFGPLAEELGAPCVAIHRAELHRVLLGALGSTPLRLGAEVRRFTQTGDSVTVELVDGTRLTADAVIAADGLHSAVRAQLHGAHAPDYAGYTSWRGLCANPSIIDPARVTESWGDASRFGLVPIGPNRLYWFAVADAPAGEHDGADPRAELRERFKGWHREVREAIEATPVDAIFRTDISDRPVLAHWGEGRVTLLGDAAHPMTPNLGQGACMAIEDALVLASATAEKAEVSAMLRLYEERRRERTATVVETARRFGKVGQLSNGVARALRNAALHATPHFVTDHQLRWLYQFDA